MVESRIAAVIGIEKLRLGERQAPAREDLYLDPLLQLPDQPAHDRQVLRLEQLRHQCKPASGQCRARARSDHHPRNNGIGAPPKG